MERATWSPVVRFVRDAIHERTEQYYNGCLINLYPDGNSAMRYHVDPDQGTLWDCSTAVASIGSSRRFAFRESEPRAPSTSTSTSSSSLQQQQRQRQQQPHTFVVMHG